MDGERIRRKMIIKARRDEWMEKGKLEKKEVTVWKDRCGGKGGENR